MKEQIEKKMGLTMEQYIKFLKSAVSKGCLEAEYENPLKDLDKEELAFLDRYIRQYDLRYEQIASFGNNGHTT